MSMMPAFAPADAQCCQWVVNAPELYWLHCLCGPWPESYQDSMMKPGQSQVLQSLLMNSTLF